MTITKTTIALSKKDKSGWAEAMQLLKCIFLKFRAFLSRVFSKKTQPIPELGAPYVTMFVNTTDKKQRCVFLGANKNLHENNFGNPEGIEIVNLNGGTYAEILSESQLYPYTVCLIRLQSNKQENVNQTFSLQRAKANGNMYAIPIRFNADVHQFQSNIVDMRFTISKEINGLTSFVFMVESNSNLVISCYPPIEKPKKSRLKFW